MLLLRQIFYLVTMLFIVYIALFDTSDILFKTFTFKLVSCAVLFWFIQGFCNFLKTTSIGV